MLVNFLFLILLDSERLVAVPEKLPEKCGPFRIKNLKCNKLKWDVTVDSDYEILMAENPKQSSDIEDLIVVSTHPIEQKHLATLFKKADGATYQVVSDTHYLIFYPGFPNGGQSYADIHAPWGTCFRDIPKDGAVILKVDSSTKEDVPGESRAHPLAVQAASVH